MALLADLERLLERVFERSTARLFHTRVQAVQVEHRIERAMERARIAEGGRTSVPDRYRVRLTPADLGSAAADAGGAELLAGRLADATLAFARSHGYHLRGRPTVSLVADPSLAPGEIEVDAVPDGAQPGPTPANATPVGWSAHASGGHVAASPPGPARRPPGVPAPAVAAPVAVASPASPGVVHAPSPEPAPAGVRGDGTQTLVFRRPAPLPASAVLRTFGPDGGELTVEVGGTPLAIGRARDNGLVLADPRVSRHHGRLHTRRGALVYTDLGSTNGSRVNGVRVDEIVLGAGDRIQLGDTVLVVETLPG